MVVDPMDKLFELYNRHIDRLELLGQELNELYEAPAEHSLKRKSRDEFATYVLGTQYEAKRLYLQRVLDGHDDLLTRLPSRVQSLMRRAA